MGYHDPPPENKKRGGSGLLFWILLIASIVCIFAVRHWYQNQDLPFLDEAPPLESTDPLFDL